MHDTSGQRPIIMQTKGE
ncbi:small acid-soluble spore protein N [Bacillus cereus group sp. BC46]